MIDHCWTVNQLLKFFGETKHDRERFGLHFPVGVGALFLTLWKPEIGITAAVLFLAYEVIQDWRKKDWSFKDVYGFVFGYYVPAIIMRILAL